MANKSSKSFDGQDREQGNSNLRKSGVEADEIKQNTTEFEPEGTRVGKQENLKNRGFQEDQPGNPVRNTGSTSKEDHDLPTGEPDAGETSGN